MEQCRFSTTTEENALITITDNLAITVFPQHVEQVIQANVMNRMSSNVVIQPGRLYNNNGITITTDDPLKSTYYRNRCYFIYFSLWCLSRNHKSYQGSFKQQNTPNNNSLKGASIGTYPVNKKSGFSSSYKTFSITAAIIYHLGNMLRIAC
jgi:hypothetical protein